MRPDKRTTDARLGHLRRAAAWQFLSLVLQPPTLGTVEKLRQIHAELSEGQRQETEALVAVLADAGQLPTLQDAYHRVLGSAGTCPPCESAYQAGGAFDRGHVLADVAGFYRAFGFQPPAAAETVGHAANEFAFLAFLELKAAYLAGPDQMEPRDICLHAMQSFLRDHVLAWVDAFGRRLADRAGPTAYGRCADLIRTWPFRQAREVEEAAGGPSSSSVVNRLIEAMKEVFGRDVRRVNHALKVLSHAEALLGREPVESALVVRAAAILHDIGILEAQRRHGSTAGCFQEQEGPPIARRIMEAIGLEAAVTDHVCRIVANHHSARDIDTPEFRIVWDADWLVNLPEEFGHLEGKRRRDLIERVFKTPTGRSMALEACDGES